MVPRARMRRASSSTGAGNTFSAPNHVPGYSRASRNATQITKASWSVILAGEAPANVVKLTREYFEVTADVRGKDTLIGRYPWLRTHRNEPGSEV